MIDNTGCDPASWNNHGSVVKAGEQWYVFYHASSNNSAFSRRARAERLIVDEAARVIRQAVPTTNGFVSPLLPGHIASPVNACRFFGGAYLTETPEGLFPCVGLRPAAGFAFSPVRFEAAEYSLTLRYTAASETRVRVLSGGRPAAEDTLLPGEGLLTHTLRFRAEGGTVPLTLEIAEGGPCAIFETLLSKG